MDMVKLFLGGYLSYLSPNFHWTTASPGGIVTLLIEVAGNASTITFGLGQRWAEDFKRFKDC